MNPESVFIDAGGVRLHVSAWGDPSKPVLFLQHGMRDHSRSWDWIAREFADKYRIYAPDLRGHGDSGWASSGGYALPNYVLDLEDIASALGADRFALVGHSFGGAIALRYTAAFPDRVIGYAGIECVELPNMRDYRAEPKSYPDRLRLWIDQERQRRTRQPRHYASLGEAEARMRTENSALPNETIAHLARHAVIVDASGNWRWKFDNTARLRAPEDAEARDLDQMLAAIACPVLLAYGAASWVPLPPPERLALIGLLSLIQFPGESHWLHHTARADFTSALSHFLSSLPER